ncbi:MAG TPA: hypothetical protein VKB21_04885, partial [Candidatus Acidoferrum sp.]|nr:hypothetical protein [Candidatus Acidoferrum sp.]
MPSKLSLALCRPSTMVLLLAALANPSAAQERDRSKVPEQYKWDLTAIYPSDQAWQEQKAKLMAELPKLKEDQGKLGSSAPNL